LIGRLALLYLLRFRRGRLLLRLSSTLVIALLAVTALLVVVATLIARTVINGEKSGNRIFNL